MSPCFFKDILLYGGVHQKCTGDQTALEGNDQWQLRITSEVGSAHCTSTPLPLDAEVSQEVEGDPTS